MLSYLDIWFGICGALGLMIAAWELRRSSPRLALLATAAWIVVVWGLVVIGLAIKYQQDELQSQQEVIEFNRKKLMEIQQVVMRNREILKYLTESVKEARP